MRSAFPIGSPARLGRPLGMFRNQLPAPQNAQGAVNQAQLEGSMGPAGIIASDTTARSSRTFTGGGIAPQLFTRAASGANTAENLQMAAFTINTRRSLSRNRGRGPGA